MEDILDLLRPKDIRKKSIYTLIGTLLVGGLIGAFALLFGNFGETELRILGTVLSIGFFILLMLSTAIWADTEYKYITVIGVLLALSGFVLTMDGLWGVEVLTDLLGDSWIEVLLWNNIILTALAISSILATVDADKNVVRSLRGVSLFLVWVTALSLGFIVSGADVLIRPAGAAGILGAATLIATLLLDKLR